MSPKGPRPGGYPHRGKHHAEKLRHVNDRRAAVHMAPVSTLTQARKEWREVQRREQTA